MVSAEGDGTGRVRFALLGAFMVLDGDRPVVVEGGRAQAVLVALLLRPEGYARAGQLISAVWGRQGTPSEDNLYHLITKLRKVLEPFGFRIGPGEAPRVRYRLPVQGAAVDVRRFEQLVGSAAALEDTEPEEALRRLREALGLWRGPAAFPELQLPGVRALGHALDVARLDAEERRAGLEIRYGRPQSLLDRLRGLAAEHPGHPELTAALLRVLHATGRTGEAERVYRNAVQRYGHRLPAKVEQAHRDRPAPVRQPPPAGLPGPAASWPVPDQIPPVSRYFTSREAELARLVGTSQPGAADADACAAAVQVVNGMAGVGKTALVLRAARQLLEAGRFPDGALFVDLHGFTDLPPAPMDPAAALDSLLRGLGVSGGQIPAEADARAALYRTMVARRRVLIVLDNARDETQVRPLLPGTATSLVLVTSRHRLAGLDDADHLNLDVLPVPEAIRLFRAMVTPRHPGDEQTIEEIAQLCGLLPLAVRIVGARLKSTRALTGPYLLAQLRAEQGRLNVLDDGERSIAAALAVSYRHLTTEQQTTFAALGLHPGLDLEPYATAALLDTTPAQAQRLLDALERVNILDQPTPGRYRFHDLVRTYATTLHPAPDQHLALDHRPRPAQPAGVDRHPGPDRHPGVDGPAGVDEHDALDRLYRHYAHAASTAMDLAYPYEADQRPRPPTPPTASPDLPTETAALTWLDTELDNLLATAHHAADHGQPDHTTHQSTTLHRHLRTRGKYHEAHALLQHALDLARATGNTTAELDALTALGYVHRLLGRYSPAATCLGQAIDLARALGNLPGELDALNGLGQVHYVEGAYGPAADCYGQALRLARASGDRPGQLHALSGLGQMHYLQGRYDPAAGCFAQALQLARATGNQPGQLNTLIGLAYINYGLGRQGAAAAGFGRALDLARSIGNRAGELNALSGLGHVHLREGRHGSAAEFYGQVLELARATGDRTAELHVLTALGHVQRLQGRHGPAAEFYRQVLELALAVGERNYQFDAHLGLGRTSQAAGDPERAFDAHRSALELARELGQRPDEVRALDGLAHAHLALGHPEQAREHWQHALDLLAGLNTLTTDDVTAADIQASLAGLDTAPEPSPA